DISTREGHVTYLDPYYNFTGKLSFEELQHARYSNTSQGPVKGEIFEVSIGDSPEREMETLIRQRFNRYQASSSITDILKFARETARLKEYFPDERIYQMGLEMDNSLQSVTDQHMNLRDVLRGLKRNEESDMVDTLANQWALVRKECFTMFVKRNAEQKNLIGISDRIKALAEKEHQLVNRITGKVAHQEN
ncbi:MAG: hypothetical protein GY757_09560, partial [bacterium]|nr:hypothetical protein [bacterium]